MESLFAPAINLAALLVFLAFKLVGPMKAFASSRQGTIREQLEASRRLLASAKTKYEDFDSRLRGLNAELQALATQSADDARRARARLIQVAEQAGGMIVADAQTAASALRTELVLQLRNELASRAVMRAEEQIRARLTGEERARLRREFSVLMEKAK
jgi:F0F1-type ATP synthase membrane subunit b/b'